MCFLAVIWLGGQDRSRQSFYAGVDSTPLGLVQRAYAFKASALGAIPGTKQERFPKPRVGGSSPPGGIAISPEQGAIPNDADDPAIRGNEGRDMDDTRTRPIAVPHVALRPLTRDRASASMIAAACRLAASAP
jgi:hypothetical protein